MDKAIHPTTITNKIAVKLLFTGVVVADQLVERLSLTPDVHGSNPVINNNYVYI